MAAAAAAVAGAAAVVAAAAGGAEVAMRGSTLPRALAAAALVLFIAAKPAATPPQSFPTPEAAVDALAQAATNGDEKAILSIFGSVGRDLVQSGDAVSDKNGAEAFAKSFAEAHRIELEGDAKATLVYGDDDFPFPAPLVKSGESWHFDSAAGREEVLRRRVGRNELSAIQVCLAYVDAQREYADTDGDKDGLFDYAQKMISTPGKKDGLFWRTEPGEAQSPLGELIAQANAKGYSDKTKPYFGYYYHILKAQGPHAPGGAYDYVVRGRMIGGYALVAWPAQYGVSGIMTFLVNHDGVVFSKDLGPNSAKLASEMTRFDPDSTWKKEE